MVKYKIKELSNGRYEVISEGLGYFLSTQYSKKDFEDWVNNKKIKKEDVIEGKSKLIKGRIGKILRDDDPENKEIDT